MPIYEYACRACGHELETLQFLDEAPLTDCPECGEAALRRKISAAGFRLSGKGWYETDFKSSDKQRYVAGERDAGDKKADKKSGQKADKKDAGKGDAVASKKTESPAKASGGKTASGS